MGNNRYHRHLSLTEDYKPNLDFSSWNRLDWEWKNFKNISLEQLNNPKLINFLSEHRITSRWIQIFHTPSNHSAIIHSDNDTYVEWAKIIFQYGAKGSKLRWWKSSKIEICSHEYGNILVAEPDFSKMIYENEVENASLINVGPLHNSHNPTNESRITVAISLYDFDGYRILWDDALDRLTKTNSIKHA
jgi:hypothetical protein